MKLQQGNFLTHSFQSLSCWRVRATLIVFLIVFSHALDHAATALANGLALLVRPSSSVLFVFSEWFHILAFAFAFGFCICVRELPLQTLSTEEGRSNMLTISSSSPAVCFANYLLLRKTEKKLSSHISRKARGQSIKWQGYDLAIMRFGDWLGQCTTMNKTYFIVIARDRYLKWPYPSHQ